MFILLYSWVWFWQADLRELFSECGCIVRVSIALAERIPNSESPKYTYGQVSPIFHGLVVNVCFYNVSAVSIACYAECCTICLSVLPPVSQIDVKNVEVKTKNVKNVTRIKNICECWIKNVKFYVQHTVPCHHHHHCSACTMSVRSSACYQ